MIRRHRHRPSLAVIVSAVAVSALVASSCGSDAAGGRAAADPPAASTTAAATTTTAPCDASGTPGTLQERTVDVGGAARWYLLTAPVEQVSPRPLVIDFHGLMEGAQIHSTMTRFSDLALAEDFLVAFPNGTGQPLAWKVGPAVVGEGVQSDLDFVTALIDDVAAEHCLDRSRIYATGLSNGAMMSSYVACALPGLFAAVAPVAGVTVFDGCEPDRPVPMLTVHGTADPILRFNGGVGDLAAALSEDGPTDTAPDADLSGPGYPAAASSWAERNGCDESPVDTELSAEVVHRVWSCPDGADTEMYIVVGGGHSWPGSEFSRSIESVVGPTTFDIDATAVAWEFFSRFSAPG